MPMPVDVITSIVIDRPRDEVAAYASDPNQAPVWYDNIKAVEWKTAPPLSLGSKVAFVAQFLGRRLAYTYEIAEYSPGEALTMRTAEGPFPMETTYRFATLPDGRTEMTLRNRGEPRGFSKIAAPLMARAMRKANEKDLAKLKAQLEA